jgi:hypothetical protein
VRTTDGKLLGTTPYAGDFPRGDDELQIVLEKRGYRSQSRRLSLSSDRTISVTLVAKERQRVDTDDRRKL